MNDGILELLIKLVEDVEPKGADQGGMLITLTVGGILISGQIISSKLYSQMFADGFIHDALKKAKASGQLESSSGDDDTDDSPHFIHLASAKFLLGNHNPIPTNTPGVLWRGRLDRIDGFFLGGLHVAGEPVA